MARKSIPDLPSLVDAFVQKINTQPREPEPVDEVPPFLRTNTETDSLPETLEGWTGWHPRIEKRIVQLDHEAIIQHGEMKVVKEIAPSFVDFVQAALR